jgi:hypothetical protein
MYCTSPLSFIESKLNGIDDDSFLFDYNCAYRVIVLTSGVCGTGTKKKLLFL